MVNIQTNFYNIVLILGTNYIISLKKIIFVILPLILLMGILPALPFVDSYEPKDPGTQCKEGQVLVFRINAQKHSCVFDSTASILETRGISSYEHILPAYDYSLTGKPDIGKQIAPQYAALTCLAWYDVKPFSHVKHARDNPENGVYVANWLERQAEQYDKYLLFRYKFHFRAYDVPAGWVNGMAQGTIAECFFGDV